MLEFETTNAVYSRAMNDEAIDFAIRALTYEKTWFQKQQYGGKHRTYTKCLCSKKGVFFTGFKDRISLLANSAGKEIKWNTPRYQRDTLPEQVPRLDSIKLRDDQKDLIYKAITLQRGILIAPARYGKTITAGGIIKSLKGVRTLFLCHTKDLLYQTFEEFIKMGISPITLYGDGRKEGISPRTLALHQTFSKVDPTSYMDYFDLVIVDECHHISDLNGNYANILSQLLSPYRIGFTATVSPAKEKQLIMEGLIGPIIGEVSQEEALDKGIIAPARVRIVKLPDQNMVKNLTTYTDAYREGIVRNRIRNRRTMKIAQEYLEQDMTVLIIVRRVEHGFNIQEMFEKFLPQYYVPFLCGGIDADTQKEIVRLKGKIKQYETVGEIKGKRSIAQIQLDLDYYRDLTHKIKKNSGQRHTYRKLLHEKKVKCIIVTTIWNEGVNIPSLNVLINAAGGKSETATIQAASRCLTAYEGKEYGIIVDFFDNNARWFIDHFGERIALYCEKGWM